MSVHITDHRGGFPPGLTSITPIDEAEDSTGIALSVLQLSEGDVHDVETERETAWLLMNGDATCAVADQTARMRRRSIFDEAPSCVHVSAGTTVRLECHSPTEFTVYEVANTRPFAPRLFQPDDVPNEHRGKGQVGDACYR